MRSFFLFNEFGLSLVKGGSWIGFSHEMEFEDGTEVRKYGWKSWNGGKFHSPYVRIWIGKRVMILSWKGFELKKKNKTALKIILGFEFRHC